MTINSNHSFEIAVSYSEFDPKWKCAFYKDYCLLYKKETILPATNLIVSDDPTKRKINLKVMLYNSEDGIFPSLSVSLKFGSKLKKHKRLSNCYSMNLYEHQISSRLQLVFAFILKKNINFAKDAKGSHDLHLSKKLDSSSLIADIANSYKDEASSDVQVICGEDNNTVIPVHSYILSIRSEVFRTMLTVDMKEKDTKQIIFDHFKAVIVEECIRFLYKDEIDLTLENVEQFYEFADMYQVKGMTDYISHRLCLMISNDNVSELARIARKFKQNDLQRSIILFVNEEQCPNERLELLESINLNL